MQVIITEAGPTFDGYHYGWNFYHAGKESNRGIAGCYVNIFGVVSSEIRKRTYNFQVCTTFELRQAWATITIDIWSNSLEMEPKLEGIGEMICIKGIKMITDLHAVMSSYAIDKRYILVLDTMKKTILNDPYDAYDLSPKHNSVFGKKARNKRFPLDGNDIDEFWCNYNLAYLPIFDL